MASQARAVHRPSYGRRRALFLPFEEAKKYMRETVALIRSAAEFKDWSRSPSRPSFIPSNPHSVYRGRGWKSYPDFCSYPLSKFDPASPRVYNVCPKFAALRWDAIRRTREAQGHFFAILQDALPEYQAQMIARQKSSFFLFRKMIPTSHQVDSRHPHGDQTHETATKGNTSRREKCGDEDEDGTKFTAYYEDRWIAVQLKFSGCESFKRRAVLRNRYLFSRVSLRDDVGFVFLCDESGKFMLGRPGEFQIKGHKTRSVILKDLQFTSKEMLRTTFAAWWSTLRRRKHAEWVACLSSLSSREQRHLAFSETLNRLLYVPLGIKADTGSLVDTNVDGNVRLNGVCCLQRVATRIYTDCPARAGYIFDMHSSSGGGYLQEATRIRLHRNQSPAIRLWYSRGDRRRSRCLFRNG
ncbi:unnamed protein product [Amoebophrya sp. A120]|nr:unnamed protein product [Amoebophrya sp. A120]|eukprot:GSA120T00004328001.1